MEQKDKQINNFHCISLVYNPLTDQVPEIFRSANKHKKEELTHDILRRSPYSGIVLLKTCQRVELYIETDQNEDTLRKRFVTIYEKYFGDQFGEKLKIYSSVDAQKHLIRLASGLESFIAGEAEIYEQINKLYKKYYSDGLSGEYLNQIFSESLEVATAARKAVATEHMRSYPDIAYEFLNEKGMEIYKVLILGNGLLARSIKEFLDEKNIKAGMYDAKSEYNMSIYNVVINCDSKTGTNVINSLNEQIFLDFSIPPLIESKNKRDSYYSIADFKQIIDRNNELSRPILSQLNDYIDKSFQK